MGMVIGREGATAKAIRTLLRVVGAKNNARVNLKINEPEGSTRGMNREAPRDESKRSIDEVVNDINVEIIKPKSFIIRKNRATIEARFLFGKIRKALT